LDYIKVKNFRASKDHNKQSEKVAHRMGENVYRVYILLDLVMHTVIPALGRLRQEGYNFEASLC
jgi:hypothetical protein